MSLTDTGVSHEQTASRASRRTRRMVIVGALAIVLVAGLVLVGAKTNGARSGALVAGSLTCKISGTGNTKKASVQWNDNEDRTTGTTAGNYTVTPTGSSSPKTVSGLGADALYTSTFTGSLAKVGTVVTVAFALSTPGRGTSTVPPTVTCS
ncbi:unannotated protein [freshwater metagenome]|uniref:Unannotated protein n=1 Tax=freshwater metagenome TaxID=449393 RepID=A0A6J7L7B8_9ZZZZ|nr:hypothetical protein [Actinomycetota bacterium]